MTSNPSNATTDEIERIQGPSIADDRHIAAASSPSDSGIYTSADTSADPPRSTPPLTMGETSSESERIMLGSDGRGPRGRREIVERIVDETRENIRALLRPHGTSSSEESLDRAARLGWTPNPRPGVDQPYPASPYRSRVGGNRHRLPNGNCSGVHRGNAE
ncbi:hypothetical protein BDN70DRAFT_939823 [Pholiota conissans]|uniref:Uncharacterized protein n=1 Tax=Pholiota conissans TaxID=109636 RepID=A0A9P5YI34_9AGAR|nr:hypothetical protein BDN70DRAFT_939823 [Pholiota conissans]